eukprot:CAMPEP_0119558482 /NCGR_PEP_ID=MMETSP1352-20130426/10818_1 /TAXON_ID=265584 /ORGANISM="Stauroneis constricta, Strain CCMP1120" /LENGTH=277 /DNA_ID=CAMNT_0007605855 /DNA_START=33 /DNA_END=862 /DNA_ORIENTATION=-
MTMMMIHDDGVAGEAHAPPASSTSAPPRPPLSLASSSSPNAASDDGGSESVSSTAATTKHVFWIRAVVFVALFLAAVAITAGMYISMHRNDVEAFELNYHDFAATIADAFETHWRAGYYAIDSFAVGVLSHTETQDEPWPFITIPQFEANAAAARQAGRFKSLTFFPLVKDELRDRYETFVRENVGWMDVGKQYESHWGIDDWDFGNLQEEMSSHRSDNDNDDGSTDAAKKQDATSSNLNMTNEGFPDTIWYEQYDGSTHPAPVSSQYLPAWQHSPV